MLSDMSSKEIVLLIILFVVINIIVQIVTPKIVDVIEG